MIQVFGQFGNYHSFAYVAREYCRALRAHGVPFMIWATDKATSPQYLDAPWANGMSDDLPTALCVDYPTPGEQHLRGYGQKILVTVCESDRIPKDWVLACNQMDLIIVPSRFCAQAFFESGVTVPISIVPHGISPVFLEQWFPHQSRATINLLHVSGTTTFHKRKGTGILLHAFSRILKDFPSIKLTLKTPKRSGLLELIRYFNLGDFVSIDDDPLGLGPREMTRYLSKFDAVVQPSRGEGWGLVPLEARCLGIPVALTNVTGHADHFSKDCDILIETGPPERLETQGNSIGKCPTLSLENLESALRDLVGNLGLHTYRTQAWAMENREKWLWINVLSPGVRAIRRVWKNASGPSRLGSTAGLG
jgi:glycosyltransferase involved in cell wall biosynthesis